MAISASLAAKLQSYAYRIDIPKDGLLFLITRSQAFRMVSDAFVAEGIRKPNKVDDRVGAVHILRHSGAIERLRQTVNPKAIHDHLRHQSAKMTLRYLKTVSAGESLTVQKGIDSQW